MRRAFPRGLALIGLVIILGACPSRDAQGKGGATSAATVETVGDSRGPDPRAAFESSNLIGGMSALLESPVTLVAASGQAEAGVSLALGGALSMSA